MELLKSVNERRAQFWLHQSGLSAGAARRIIELSGSAEAVLSKSPLSFSGLGLAGADSAALVDFFSGERKRREWDKVYEAAIRGGWRFLCGDELTAAFPGIDERDRPLGCWVRGTINFPFDRPAAALVGARQATPYGLAVAEKLADFLARRGVIVVSGLAYGIDAAAHRAAIAGGGVTAAFLGTGPDIFYPQSNRALQNRDIPQSGLVCSEYPWGTGPQRGHFPRRNRLIAGCSSVVVVIEGDEDSGALITARWAAVMGKDVFAVPGSIFSRMSRGPNRLIKEGAVPLTDFENLINEASGLEAAVVLRSPAQSSSEAPRAARLTAAASALLGQLRPDGTGLDVLLAGTGLAIEEAMPALLELEMKGLVRSGPGGYVPVDDGRARG